MFFDFHVHAATELDQTHGCSEEHYAEPTSAYTDFRGAIHHLLAICSFASGSRNAAVTLRDLAETFSQAVGAEVRVEPLGAGEARVFVPFEFPDGDPGWWSV